MCVYQSHELSMMYSQTCTNSSVKLSQVKSSQVRAYIVIHANRHAPRYQITVTILLLAPLNPDHDKPDP